MASLDCNETSQRKGFVEGYWTKKAGKYDKRYGKTNASFYPDFAGLALLPDFFRPTATLGSLFALKAIMKRPSLVIRTNCTNSHLQLGK